MAGATSDDNLIYFNGINGLTGEYTLPPMSGKKLAGLVTGEEPPENLSELRYRQQKGAGDHLGVREGVDPHKLEESGWGVIFAHDADPAVKEALSDLLALRESEAGEYYHVYEGPDGYRPGESKSKFLARHGAGPGPADPEKVPYYLLIVGSPEAIPYKFQTQLDVQYAVGRIHFNSLQEYANYARSVVAAESGKVKLSRRAAYFGVAHKDDPATKSTAANLVEPLYQKYKDFGADGEQWSADLFLEEQASKANLARLLGGDLTPALLFTGSHGMELPVTDKRQPEHQGALICSDWPGPGGGGIKQEYYFAGEDLTADTNLLGMISFFFACYGGGTPLEDKFFRTAFKDAPEKIAPYPFMAQLPRQMLALPQGGALAAIGHVERAWGYSFLWPGAGAQVVHFESTLEALMKGYRVGYALEYFNERYAEIATVLSDDLDDIEAGQAYDPYELASMWTANNDARGYAIIGDPAVRLPVVDEGAEAVRTAIVVKEVAGQPSSDVRVEEHDGPEDPGEPERTTDESASQGRKTVKSNGSDEIDEAILNLSPVILVPEGYDKEHPELYAAYVEHVKSGYRNNDAVFNRIMNAFMRGHYSSLIMNWLLFIIGIGFFTATGISALAGAPVTSTLVFGGLGTVTFVSYFLTRPTQAVEENLQFITWLGIIYNTYWTHLMWVVDQETAQEQLDEATEEAIERWKEMMERHAEISGTRPGVEEE